MLVACAMAMAVHAPTVTMSIMAMPIPITAINVSAAVQAKVLVFRIVMAIGVAARRSTAVVAAMAATLLWGSAMLVAAMLRWRPVLVVAWRLIPAQQHVVVATPATLHAGVVSSP